MSEMIESVFKAVGTAVAGGAGLMLGVYCLIVFAEALIGQPASADAKSFMLGLAAVIGVIVGVACGVVFALESHKP